MSLLPNYILDSVAGTSELKIFVQQNLLNLYTYENNIFTLGATSQATQVGIPELKDNVKVISNWIGLIQTFLPYSIGPRSPFENRMRKTGTILRGRFERGVLITDVTFSSLTNQAVFDQESQRTLEIVDFIAWVDFLSIFVKNAENF